MIKIPFNIKRFALGKDSEFYYVFETEGVSRMTFEELVEYIKNLDSNGTSSQNR